MWFREAGKKHGKWRGDGMNVCEKNSNGMSEWEGRQTDREEKRKRK